MDDVDNWKKTTMMIGIIAGAIMGVAGAMIVIERATREQTRPQISAGDGVKLGLGILGVMRLIADLGDRE